MTPVNDLDEILPELSDGQPETTPARSRHTTLLTCRLLKSDVIELQRIAKRRGDGWAASLLIFDLVHSGVNKLRELEA